MDHIDFLYVRVKTEELLDRISESDSIALQSDGMAAAKSDSVKPRQFSLWYRLRRAIRMRRLSIRVLSDVMR